MKLLRMLLIAAFCFALVSSVYASPPEDHPPFGFAIDIVGTAHFTDIEHIKKGLARADGAHDVRVTRSGQSFTRLEGVFVGTREHFTRDLEGLTQDRFDVRINEKNNSTLDVTLTKLEPLVP